MRRVPSALALAALAAGCSTLGLGSSGDERKAACDRIAAQAIQTESAAEARRLAAEASECYARITSD